MLEQVEHQANIGEGKLTCMPANDKSEPWSVEMTI